MFDSGTDEILTAVKIRPRWIRNQKEIEDILGSKSGSDSEDTSKTSAYEEMELQMAGSQEELKIMNLALKDFNDLDYKTQKWLEGLGYSEEFYNMLNTEARRMTLRCLECTAQCKYRELYDSLS